ncbi:MAG: hypothetical protein Q8Q33_00375, partial [Chlamydiota bacterium]|nr:hypothetical protein [Chlamydiota bacterium]
MHGNDAIEKMEFGTEQVKLIKSFLGSLLSGIVFAWIYSCNTITCLQIILACFSLGPFLNGCLAENWKESFLAYIGFSVPIVITLGEGLWFGMHYYYQLSMIPSLLVFVVWVWILSTLHWLVFALIGRYFQYWSLPFIWVALEFL